jgi:hypothetical protein
MKYKGIPLLPLLTAAAATTVFVTYRSSMRVQISAPESTGAREEL